MVKSKLLIILIILICLVVGGFFVWKNIVEKEEEKLKPETGFEWFQTGNTLLITQLQPKQSRELEDRSF